MKVLSLFSGVGGLDLGLERAGMTVVGQVEIDPYCRSVLARHWPDVPRHDDVTTAPAWWSAQERPHADLVAGGPPCQPFSSAGRRRGVADERWMWPAMAAVVRVVRPRYVLLENSPDLLADPDAFGWVLADLAELGFDAEWSVLSACAVGAPHPRRRLFMVAHARGDLGQTGLGTGLGLGVAAAGRRASESVDGRAAQGAWRDRVDRAVATAGADGRDADGLARRMVAAGGNAVVPAVAELVGRMILSADQAVVSA